MGILGKKFAPYSALKKVSYSYGYARFLKLEPESNFFPKIPTPSFIMGIPIIRKVRMYRIEQTGIVFKFSHLLNTIHVKYNC